jgi:cyanophycin synthetase
VRILAINNLAGPNIYLHRPVLVMKLDLQELTERQSNEFEDFITRLVSLLRGLGEHGCDRGTRGRFLERLHTGTYFGHIVEHVALELSGLAGVSSNFGKTRSAGETGIYNVIVEYRAEATMRYLLQLAVDLVEATLRDEPFPLEARLVEARRITAARELGPSTRAIVDAAERRGIPWRRLNEDSLIQLGYGKYLRHVQAAMSSQSSAVAVEIVGNKELTKRLLRQAFIPVPDGQLVGSAEEAVAVWEAMDCVPAVVKPLDGQQGNGVSVNLRSAEAIQAAFAIAQTYSAEVLLEEFLAGRDYRVLWSVAGW